MGQNGAGKSSIIKLLNGMLQVNIFYIFIFLYIYIHVFFVPIWLFCSCITIFIVYLSIHVYLSLLYTHLCFVLFCFVLVFALHNSLLYLSKFNLSLSFMILNLTGKKSVMMNEVRTIINYIQKSWRISPNLTLLSRKYFSRVWAECFYREVRLWLRPCR